MKITTIISLLFFILIQSQAHAKIIQIIHTNDLHSYFQGTRGGIGGYAQLKKVVEEIKQNASSRGIPTLFLDGGDFGEGSSFYFSDNGVNSLKALDLLGVDAAVLGNHDFMHGPKDLKRQIREANLKTKIISANLKGKLFMGLRKSIPSFVDYQFDEVKIRVFGLTTSELHYMYPLRPVGYIIPPLKAGIKQAKKARRAGIDLTIALTHIGLSNDINLASKTRSIDMIIGGHSHTLLSRPEYINNLENRPIPIVQAGAHSGHLGVMLLDIQGKKNTKILDYQMIKIIKDMPQDETMRNFVQKAYQDRENYFGRSWDEEVGISEITLSGNYNGRTGNSNTCWARHMARLTRTVTKADLGLQFDVFQGEQIDPGIITFGDIVDNFPHVRSWGDNGWKMARARVSGFLLKKILTTLANSEIALQVTIDGARVSNKSQNLNYDLKNHQPDQALIDNQEINNLRFYTIGLPYEIPYGLYKFAYSLSYLIFQNMTIVEDSEYWPHLENYIRTNSPLKCLVD